MELLSSMYLLDIPGPEVSDFVCTFRMIDSAQAYDEEQVGAAVQESGIPREDIFIVSKVHPRFLGHDETLKSVEETLAKLKVLNTQHLIFCFVICDGLTCQGYCSSSERLTLICLSI